jgi:hypothetical protein
VIWRATSTPRLLAMPLHRLNRQRSRALSFDEETAMARTAVATLQTAPDCRWSRLGHRLNGVAEEKQPETTWVCVREGIRRDLREDECATCPHWELDDAEAERAATSGTEGIRAFAISEPVVDRPVRTWSLVGGFCFGITAAALYVAAMVLVTEPLAVGFTIAAWLGTAAIVGVVGNGLRSNE